MRQAFETRSGFRALALTIGLIALAGATACQPDDGIRMPPTLDATADDPVVPEDLLEEMSGFISSHSTFAFEALVTYETMQESGQKLRFDLVQSIAVKQPDQLWWTTLRDDGTTNTAWFSDGVFTMLKQPENIYGQIDRLGTIPTMIDVMTNDYGIVVPFADLLAGGDGPVFLEDLESIFDAGLAWVDGAWTNHLAMRNELVDFEIWIRKDGDPVPQKIAITWKHEDGLPSFVARLRNWRFPSALEDSRFEFVAPPDAEHIEIIPAAPAYEGGA
jgi:hypothetical protein